MRIWSIHPKYLDTKGLVALWRETLLAQKVLMGETKGYKNHPQLDRFKATKDPVGAIALYLTSVYEEAVMRGYNFDKSKIATPDYSVKIPVTEGQVSYELSHLKKKLAVRDIDRYRSLPDETEPELHLLFTLIPGDIEPWEVVQE